MHGWAISERLQRISREALQVQQRSLYPALYRLEHVARLAACPVIVDDILIHSDDLRASAALQVLAEIAQRTQVLFFTHHSRLADLGLKAGASVIHLQPSAASAVA